MRNRADDDLKRRQHDIQRNTDERALARDRMLIGTLYVAEKMDMEVEVSMSDTGFYQTRPAAHSDNPKFSI